MEYVKWEGPKKDLRFIVNSIVEEVLLVDDYEGYVLDEQKKHWVAIKKWESFYPDDDRELILILQKLVAARER